MRFSVFKISEKYGIEKMKHNAKKYKRYGPSKKPGVIKNIKNIKETTYLTENILREALVKPFNKTKIANGEKE
jgi:hypothetical protein